SVAYQKVRQVIALEPVGESGAQSQALNRHHCLGVAQPVVADLLIDQACNDALRRRSECETDPIEAVATVECIGPVSAPHDVVASAADESVAAPRSLIGRKSIRSELIVAVSANERVTGAKADDHIIA